MCWKSTGTHEARPWVYLAWLAWLGATLWVIHQTLQDALNGRTSYYITLGLAAAAGLLSIPLLNRASVVNILILVPVWLFGAWYSMLSMKLPAYWLLAPFFCYAGVLVAGGLIVWGWEQIQKRAISPPAAEAEQGGRCE
ncbi:MAG: hypothetical protein KatS3mg016_0860 [Fimbriimonadales bacterium]|nr:MAG: hypothetical protein KatS3mg016_0860 [Fimbriimonadales bacterium]